MLSAQLGAISQSLAPVVQRSLRTLDSVLAEKPWLAMDHFTVADLNVAGVLSPSRTIHLDMKPYRLVVAWLSACYDRQAARTTRTRFAA